MRLGYSYDEIKLKYALLPAPHPLFEQEDWERWLMEGDNLQDENVSYCLGMYRLAYENNKGYSDYLKSIRQRFDLNDKQINFFAHKMVTHLTLLHLKKAYQNIMYEVGI